MKHKIFVDITYLLFYLREVQSNEDNLKEMTHLVNNDGDTIKLINNNENIPHDKSDFIEKLKRTFNSLIQSEERNRLMIRFTREELSTAESLDEAFLKKQIRNYWKEQNMNYWKQLIINILK